jgi:hypothetical protein
LADPADEVEVSIAKKKIAKINAQMVLTESNQELNNEAILKAEQEHTAVERSRACRKDLLAQLEDDTGNGICIYIYIYVCMYVYMYACHTRKRSASILSRSVRIVGLFISSFVIIFLIFSLRCVTPWASNRQSATHKVSAKTPPIHGRVAAVLFRLRERDGGFRGGAVGRLCVMIKLCSAMQALMTMGALEIASLMGPCSMAHLFTSMPKEPSIVILREL